MANFYRFSSISFRYCSQTFPKYFPYLKKTLKGEYLVSSAVKLYLVSSAAKLYLFSSAAKLYLVSSAPKLYLVSSELGTLEWINFNPDLLIRISTVETFHFCPNPLFFSLLGYPLIVSPMRILFSHWLPAFL